MKELAQSSLLRTTHLEKLEELIVLSANPVADFYLDDAIETQVVEQVGELQTLLADVHANYGVTHAHQEYGLTGRGQTVAVIDSGVAWDHEALGGGFGEDYRVVGGWDFTEENDANPYDDGPGGFHGTHVSGIIASDDSTYTGVAPGVDLVSLRVFNDQGAGYFSWVENALQWVHDNRNAFEYEITTVNLSLGTNWNSDSIPNWANLEDEFAQLEEDGIFISVAAGNGFGSYQTTGLSYPAVSPYVVPVASVTNSGEFSTFSQRNDRVIAAPGQSITSTVPDYAGNHNLQGDDFGTASGTSMAAPYMAGASVLVRQAMEFVGLTDITQDSIYDHIRDTADLFYDSATGDTYHRLNITNALDALMPEDDFGSTAQTGHSLGTLVDSTQVSGLIGRLSDADYFSFTASATGEVAIGTTATHDLAAEWSLVDGEGQIEDGSFVFDVVAGETYTVSLSSGDGIGYYDLEIELTASMIDLGAITDLRITDQAVAGEKWYQVEASQDGLLTLQAIFRQSAGDIDLEVFNSDMEHVASSATSSNRERVDLAVTGGETFYVCLAGTNADVDLKALNLVQVSGNQVNLTGTDQNDVFVFRAGTESHYVRVNGFHYVFDASAVNSFSIDAKEGADRVVLRGTSGDETAVLRPNEGTFTGEHFTVSVSDSERIRIFGRGGDDTVHLYDSAQDDTYIGTKRYSIMQGAGYRNLAYGFHHAYGHATAGGNDTAKLHGTAGDDTFSASEFHSKIQSDGYMHSVSNFDRVYAYGKSGGTDVATFQGTAGDDTFVSTPRYAVMRGDTYYHFAKGFGRVSAYSTGEGTDVARFRGSAGDDVFTSTSNYAQMRGEGFFNFARGFDRVYGYAGRGGVDIAQMHGTAGDDNFIGTPRYARMRGEQFYQFARNFDQVYAYAGEGGNDTATLFDGAGNDHFTGESKYSLFRGENFYNYVQGFDSVEARSVAGGFDTAVFSSLTSAQTFYGRQSESSVQGGDSLLQGYGFEKVTATAKEGESFTSDVLAVDYLFSAVGQWDD